MKNKVYFGIVICTLLCICMAFSAFAAGFSDLSDSHWAYKNIMDLSSEGVINGYSDGTFRPEAQVTRAEFVKLIGTTNERKAGDFADLPKTHWAYEYVMNSGVDMDRRNFRPDENITRAEVLDILWNRYGTKTDIVIPGIIADQHDDKDAVAWAYSYGLMIGDDGINMRLSDDLSRAEAVTLILRSRKIDTTNPKLLADNVADNLLKDMFNSTMYFDSKYDENATMSVGEVSRAALRIAHGTHTILYNKDMYVEAPDYEDEYAYDVAYMTKQVFGQQNNTKEYATKAANQEEVILALMYGYMFKANDSPVIGKMGDYYKDTEVGPKELMKNMLLTYTNRKGVFSSNDGLLHKDKPVTHKEIASILLQLENLTGSQYSYAGGKKQDEKLSFDANLYKKADSDFMTLLKGLPEATYTTPVEGSAAEFLTFSKDFFEIFSTLSDGITSKANGRGADIIIRAYPTLVSNAGNEVIMRVKVFVASNPNGLGLGEIIGKCDMAEDVKARENGTYIVDISTNAPLDDMYINPAQVSLRRIIWND